jgi:YfiH family protein
MTAEFGSDWPTPNRAAWPPGVRALTTTRGASGGFGFNLGDHVGDDPARVLERRRLLVERTGVSAIQWLRQVHGTRCVEATPTSVAAPVPEADAAWTRTRGLGIAVLTADCVPVVVAARDGSAVGVAHGGWRGLVGGVVAAMLDAMPVDASDAVAWIGPAIGPDAYEVGEDVAAAVRTMPHPEAAGALLAGRRPGRYQLDLFALTRALLERAGVGSIATGAQCTFTDARFYSFRGEGDTGRMATLAWLA